MSATVHQRLDLSKENSVLNISLWVVQFLLFASFCIGAWMKLMKSITDLAALWPWTGDLPETAVRALGVVDLAGGLGVLLPMLVGIKPRLTVWAAIGCIGLQLCAIAFHFFRGEASVTPVNFTLLAMAVFIAWGRWNIPKSFTDESVPLRDLK